MPTKTRFPMQPIKPGLHPRNRHRHPYDFALLAESYPRLQPWVKPNAYGVLSIDFANANAVKALNAALLKCFYQIAHWDLPDAYLCPPIPGRADYIHYLADLIAADNRPSTSQLPSPALTEAPTIRVLDIGVGANSIYPLIGHRSYGWQFIGTDINPTALAHANQLISKNGLQECIQLRLQSDPRAIFQNVIHPSETFTLTMCNPPFHASKAEALAATQRKLRGLRSQHARGVKLQSPPHLNFGGQNAELFCEGGEIGFLRQMVSESRRMARQSLWFTSLVSKATHLPSLQHQLKTIGAQTIKIVPMQQGQKQSRILAWTFFSSIERQQILGAKTEKITRNKD